MKTVTLLLISLLNLELCHAQSGQWTWMKGDTSFYDWLHKDSLGVEDPTFHPSALYMASNWTDDQGRLWLFGGLTYNSLNLHKQYFDFIWRYNPATNNWACMKASPYINSFGEYGILGVADSNNYPSSRIAAGFWKDTSGGIWMFGGVNAFGAWNDLWKYDMDSNTWTWVKGPDTWDVAGSYGEIGVPSPANNPPPRGESASWIDANNDLWLFGGYWLNTSVGWEYYSDLWKYNIATNMWTWMGGSNEVDQNGNNGIKGIPSITNLPKSRSCNCTWTDTAGNFYLFGGNTFWPLSELFDDVWRYSPNTKEWTWLSGLDTTDSHGFIDEYCEYSNENLPISRAQSACIKLNNDEIFMFGGFVRWTPSASITRDVWKYKISTNEWKIIWGDSVHVPGNFGIQGVYSPTNDPPSREGASCWKGNNDTVWIYGGNYNISWNSMADLWRYVLDSSCTIISTSEEVNAENSAIDVYPNPATDYFNIKLHSCKTFPVEIIIRSLSGTILFKTEIATSNISVDITDFTPGLYFIEIASNEYRKLFKLVKL
ncbi:MAG: kelch repeat-containing protein [Chitinophagales bacterium]